MAGLTAVDSEIGKAKMLLDGARAIHEHNPTAENERIMHACEAEMNALLEHYPTERGTP